MYKNIKLIGLSYDREDSLIKITTIIESRFGTADVSLKSIFNEDKKDSIKAKLLEDINTLLDKIDKHPERYLRENSFKFTEEDGDLLQNKK